MKKNVAVLFGGCSSEHEVSLRSASYILRQLDGEKYNITALGITKDGRWLLYPGPVDALADGSWEKDPGCKPAFLSPDRVTRGIVVMNGDGVQVLPIDVIVPVLHGKNGEDGTMQGLFPSAESPMWAVTPFPLLCAWIRQWPTPCSPIWALSRLTICGSLPTGMKLLRKPSKTKSHSGWISRCS